MKRRNQQDGHHITFRKGMLRQTLATPFRNLKAARNYARSNRAKWDLADITYNGKVWRMDFVNNKEGIKS